jgi:hypothetical protein
MIKIRILSTCPHCHGEAYLEVREAEDLDGNSYIRGRPCFMCEGSGVTPEWVSLPDFTMLLQQAQCPHEHASFNGSFRFTEGDVWDDIHAVCDDCGVALERLHQ